MYNPHGRVSWAHDCVSLKFEIYAEPFYLADIAMTLTITFPYTIMCHQKFIL